MNKQIENILSELIEDAASYTNKITEAEAYYLQAEAIKELQPIIESEKKSFAKYVIGEDYIQWQEDSRQPLTDMSEEQVVDLLSAIQRNELIKEQRKRAGL